MHEPQSYDRRTVVGLLATGVALMAFPAASAAAAAPALAITVWKSPSCGCCGAWVEHLKRNGFTATVVETDEIQHIKKQRGVPSELASCHTAEIGGYIVEGHVPASAILRLLSEKPAARGLSVPGMPIGSPGMEGGTPEAYDVVLFGEGAPKRFARYLGETPVP